MTVLRDIDIDIVERESLASHTIFKIGGPARWFYNVKDRDGLRRIVDWTEKNHIPFIVIGGGSNILVSDEGYDGLIIKMEDHTFQVADDCVTTAAGASLALVSKSVTDEGLTGFEWAFGIPGTVGGAVRGNAEAFGNSIADIATKIELLDGATGNFFECEPAEMNFEYRRSICVDHPSWIVVRAVFQLQRDSVAACRERLADFLQKKKNDQPLGVQCAGCCFKNVEVSRMNRSTEIPVEFLRKGFVSAGYLIEHAHMKNHVIGRAMVSPKHANFIVNLGGATARDIRDLMALVKERVAERFGVELEEEVQLIGF
jgi:UDP-N-acetylmuramate dehydrogenase